MYLLNSTFLLYNHKNNFHLLSFHERRLHFFVGEKIDRDKIDYVICIGDLAKEIYNGANRNFNVNHLFHFETNEEVVKKVKELISEDTLIMVKGSRGMKLENIIEMLKEI